MKIDWFKWLRTSTPQTGRVVCEDGTTFNIGDSARGQHINISRGACPGKEPFTAFGLRNATGGETNQPVVPVGMTVQRAPAGGVQLSFVSSSAQDAPGGTGIRRLMMTYIRDRDLQERTEIIALAGTTPVLTHATDIAFVQHLSVFCADCVGSGNAAAGNITATAGGLTYGTIRQGRVMQESSFRMIPGGKTFYVDMIVPGSTSTTADARSTVFTATMLNGIIVPSNGVSVFNGSVPIPVPVGRPVPGGAIVGLTHTTNKAATITGSYFGRIEEPCVQAVDGA